MKKGHDIKEVVQKINNDVQYKKDYIVTLNALQINKSEKVFPNVQITDSTLGNRLHMRSNGPCIPVQSRVRHTS